MSGDQGSEEKSLPPTDKKLREARKKGQIAKSTDSVSAISVTMLTLYLVMAWPSILEEFSRMFDVAARAAIRGGPSSWEGAFAETAEASANIIIPIYLLGLAATFLGGVLSNKGVVFAFDPLKPDLKRIHPVEGFKKIFSVRNVVEFLKALVKSILLLGALGLSAWYGLAAIMRIPYCGSGCADDVLVSVAGPLVIIALMLFLFGAMIDMGVQKWLFTRDMRMTHTEQKREMKETFGDPHIRSARKQLQRADATGETGKASGSLQSRQPTMLICSGSEVAIALRYVRGETPAPVVVGKGTGARAASMIHNAIDSRIFVENDSDLAKDLLRRAKMESFIPESSFREIARILGRVYGSG